MNIFGTAVDFSKDFSFILGLIVFSASLVVSYFCYNIIIRGSKVKTLMSEPNQRDLHLNKIPNLGGLAIFIAMMFVITILGNYFENENLLNPLVALTIIFLAGLVDDLVEISSKNKLMAQIIVCLSIIVLTDIRLESFYGFIGIYELPYLVSVCISLFLIVTILNAYTLIDKVDGLAVSVPLTLNVFFGCIYYMNNNYYMCLLSIGIVGALISFLIFNFSKEKKVYMGNAGSMIIGFLLAFQVISVISLNFNQDFNISGSNSIFYMFALFSFPLLDVLRVFFTRIKAGNTMYRWK